MHPLPAATTRDFRGTRPNLKERYREIGISAVAAAVRCQPAQADGKPTAGREEARRLISRLNYIERGEDR